MRCRVLFGCLLAAAIAIPLSSGCEAGQTNAACARLQDFSCHCFPLCLSKYNATIDSADTNACNKAIADAYAYWKPHCTKACTPNCQYGWGSCAQAHYREIGKSASHPCTANGKDAGADGS